MTVLSPDTDAIFGRVLAACCPDSTVDLREHARLVTDVVLAAHARSFDPGFSTGPGRTSSEGTRAAGARGGEFSG